MADLTDDERQFVPSLQQSWQQYLAPILSAQASPSHGGRVRYRTSPADPDTLPQRSDAQHLDKGRLKAWVKAQKFVFEYDAWYSTQGNLKRRVLAINDVVPHTWALFLRMRPTHKSGPRAPGFKPFLAAVVDAFIGIEYGDIQHLHKAFAHALSDLKAYRGQQLHYREHSAPHANAIVEGPVSEHSEHSSALSSPPPGSLPSQPTCLVSSPSTAPFGQPNQPGCTTSQHEALLQTLPRDNTPMKHLNPPRTGFSPPEGTANSAVQQYSHHYGPAPQGVPAGHGLSAMQGDLTSSSTQGCPADDYGITSSRLGPLPTPPNSSNSLPTRIANTSRSPHLNSPRSRASISPAANSLAIAGQRLSQGNDSCLTSGLAVPASPPLSSSGSRPLTPTPFMVAEEDIIIELTDENSTCLNQWQTYQRLRDKGAINQQDFSTIGIALHNTFEKQSMEIDIHNQRLQQLKVRAEARRRVETS